MAKVSVLGMWRENPQLFDGLILPDDFLTQYDNTVDQIILQCAPFEILYPDPVFLQSAITIWATTQKPVWEKYGATLLLTYNPIDNYDRTETETISTSKTSSMQKTDTGTEDYTLSNSKSGTLQDTRTATADQDGSGTAGSTNTGTQATAHTGYDDHMVAAFNSETYQNKNKDVYNTNDQRIDNLQQADTWTDSIDTSSSATQNQTSTETASDTMDRDTTATSNSTGTDTESVTRSNTMHGNIGVTTTQQMIEQERAIVGATLVQYIVDDFKHRFCILVY